MYLRGVVVVATLSVLLFAASAGAASSYIDFDRHATYKKLSSGKKKAVVVKRTKTGAGYVRLASSGLNTGRDGGKMYDGDRYYWGALTSKAYRTSTRFNRLVPSWNATTPAGTWVQLEVKVRSGGRWTRWFNMGVWARGTGTVKRHSVGGQSGSGWRVVTDTLQSGSYAGAYRYRLKLFTERQGRSPRVNGLFFTASDSSRHGTLLVRSNGDLWGRDLAVPQRSQMIYPNGGEVWCSPTSLSMVMAYWAKKTGRGNLNQTVPAVARGTYDYVYGGNGNWPFNTAYASAYGLRASVNRFSSLGQVERWIGRGVPVVASISWESGELSGAPIPSSQGHLLVIRGFTRSGDVIVNDPAASSNSGVRRVYDRAQFARAWFQRGSGGIAYLVYPKGWRIPDGTYARGSW